MARLSFRCDEDLLRRVDERRGGVPRERWLRAVVEFALTVDARGPFRSTWEAQVAPKFGPLPGEVGGPPEVVEQALGDSTSEGSSGRASGAPLAVPAPAESPARNLVRQHSPTCRCSMCVG